MRINLSRGLKIYTIDKSITDFSDLYLFKNRNLYSDYVILPQSINSNSLHFEINFNPVSSSVSNDYIDAVIINYPEQQSNFNKNGYSRNDYINELNFTYNSIQQLHKAYGKVIEIIRNKIEINKQANRLQVGQLVFKNINNLDDQFYNYELASHQIVNNELTKTYSVLSEK